MTECSIVFSYPGMLLLHWQCFIIIVMLINEASQKLSWYCMADQNLVCVFPPSVLPSTTG